MTIILETTTSFVIQENLATFCMSFRLNNDNTMNEGRGIEIWMHTNHLLCGAFRINGPSCVMRIIYVVFIVNLNKNSSGLWWSSCEPTEKFHEGVIKWKHFLSYWLFVRGSHQSPVDSPHKGQWRGVLMFSLMYDWRNNWAKWLRHQWFETPWRSLWRHCNAELHAWPISMSSFRLANIWNPIVNMIRTQGPLSSH